jgi:hypothetical protein
MIIRTGHNSFKIGFCSDGDEPLGAKILESHKCPIIPTLLCMNGSKRELHTHTRTHARAHTQDVSKQIMVQTSE